MNDLIILGLIPGTQIQVTFADWLTLLALVFAIYFAVKSYRTMKANQVFDQVDPVRIEAHATHLHQRVK